MIRLTTTALLVSIVSFVSAQDPSRSQANAKLPVLKVDTTRLLQRQRDIWKNIELRGTLMTGGDVAKMIPGSPDALSASGDVYFVGCTTFLADMPGRVLSAEIKLHTKDFGHGTIHIVRAGHFSKGSREFCVQLWKNGDSMMVMGRPDGYSDADVAEHGTKLDVSVRAGKMFVK